MSESLSLDARALALLGPLLDASEVERQNRLSELASTDPALRARVQRLLDASGDEADTRRLATPLLDGLREAALPRAGQLIAGWRLLRELGHGGMSTVWLAERAEGDFRRQVALKLPLRAQPGSVLAERFARERDLLAALDHPHIARLFDAGVTPEGQPWIVLEFVEGQPLTAYAAQQRLGIRERLALFLQVLGAVDHAHRHLAVHRDLKPGNILVNTQGQVKLLDFGIAKLLADNSGGVADLTQDAAALLTPRYAAPEQVLGRPVSTATDVYSAGVVLHELLTGRLPYGNTQTTPAQALQAVLHEEVRAPGLSADIDTVLLKALRKDPAERYASIERMAEDLRRVLAHEPILARRVPWWQRLQLLLRRHPRSSLASAVAMLLVLTAAAYSWQQQRAKAEQTARAAAVRDFLFEMVSDAEPDAQGEVTGRQIVDAAVARARKDFADQPVLRGEILGELGRVYNRLGQEAASLNILDEAIALLQQHAASGSGSLNKARIWRAEHLRVAGDLDGAQALTRQALQACTEDSDDCRKARAHGHGTLRNIAAFRGDAQQALVEARATVTAAQQAFGAEHAETGAHWQYLAIVARNAARYDEAAQAIAQALAIHARHRGSEADAVTLARTQAVIELDLGHYAAAAEQLQGLVARAPNEVERATQWRLLAQAAYGLGDSAAARDAATRAVAAAESGKAPREVLFARQAGARAQALQGQARQGAVALDTVLGGLQGLKYGPDSPEMLRASRLKAEAQLRAGDLGAARATVEAVLQGHARASHPHPVDHALAHELLGSLALAAGDVLAARQAHQRAADGLAAVLAPAHPLRLRNTLHLALVQHAAQHDAASRSAVQAALRSTLEGLPAGSDWRRLGSELEQSLHTGSSLANTRAWLF